MFNQVLLYAQRGWLGVAFRVGRERAGSIRHRWLLLSFYRTKCYARQAQGMVNAGNFILLLSLFLGQTDCTWVLVASSSKQQVG
jgi:hypothetical protein